VKLKITLSVFEAGLPIELWSFANLFPEFQAPENPTLAPLSPNSSICHGVIIHKKLARRVLLKT
jgi:hypothetical protein